MLIDNKDFNIYGILDGKDFLNESSEIEYKSAKGGLPGSLWETYSAFANSEGGNIILGAVEKDDKIVFEGLTRQQILKYQDDFWNLVNNKSKVSVNLLNDNHVKSFEIKSGWYVLAINVPPADYKNKPVYIGSDPLKGTYKRNNTGDYHCSQEEVRQMIADSLPQKPDSRILDDFSFDDLDKTSLNQFRQLFSISKPGHPFLAEDDKGLLEKMGGWRKDRRLKKEGLTVAGLLTFGKYHSIIDAFPDFHLDYQEILESDNRWSDRVFPDGTWEANIFQFYRRVWPKISSSLPKPFYLQDGQRKDDDAIHEALREALVNTLVHADYSIPGGIIIKKYPDYFHFSNPGNLLITVDQYYRGGISIPRNNSIQTMFILLGLGEKAGSGSSRILSAWDGQHWRKPFINNESNPARVDLYLRMESLLSQKSIDKLEKTFGAGIKNLLGNGLIALTTANIEGSVTNIRLQQLVNAHSSEISRLLKELCVQGYLIPSGIGRGTTYKLNSNPILETLTLDSETLTPNLDTSVANHDTSIPKRLKKSDLQNLILENCKDQYFTIDEIAKRVTRKAAYIQNEILPELISEGKLERLYPETPNHPKQAYSTKT